MGSYRGGTMLTFLITLGPDNVYPYASDQIGDDLQCPLVPRLESQSRSWRLSLHEIQSWKSQAGLYRVHVITVSRRSHQQHCAILCGILDISIPSWPDPCGRDIWRTFPRRERSGCLAYRLECRSDLLLVLAMYHLPGFSQLKATESL